MTADLSALIARLEAAEVGSRELDLEVCNAAGVFASLIAWDNGAVTHGGPPYTSSLDAALALAERLGCGRTYVLDNAIQTTVRALPTAHLWNDHGKHTGHARTMPIALCIATLRAKQGEGE